MIAVDTNVIIRYLTADDAEQTERARDLIDGQSVFVSLTVVMEVEWVLRSTYRFNRTDILNTIRIFAGMPMVAIEEDGAVAAALDLVEQGVDFADALHLVRTEHCNEFVTFDRKLVRAANAAGYTSAKDA